jgi:hypothetical protein
LSYDEAVRTGKLYGGRGSRDKETDKTLAEKAIETFKMGDKLELALMPERRPWDYYKLTSSHPYGDASAFGGIDFDTGKMRRPYSFDPEAAGKLWRQSEAAKSFQDPYVLAQVIRYFQTGGGSMKLSEEGIQNALKGLESGFPETYKQAFQIASDEIHGLSDNTKNVNLGFVDLDDSTSKLRVTFGLADKSVDAFGLKLRNFQVPLGVPTPDRQPFVYGTSILPTNTSPTFTFGPGGGKALNASPTPIGGFGGGKVLGGRVLRGVSYLGGEVGPELFTPDQSGFVISNIRLRELAASLQREESGGPSITVNLGDVNVTGASNDVDQVLAQVRERQDEQLEELRRELNDRRRFDRMGARAIQIGKERA